MSTRAEPRPTRRSQAERSASTREALLDATIACLVEDGYANTTTARVSERAGLSRGAHLHHFQTRQALLAAAMEHLAERRGREPSRSSREAPGRQASGWRRGSTCCGKATPAPSIRRRSICGPTPAPTPSCGSA